MTCIKHVLKYGGHCRLKSRMGMLCLMLALAASMGCGKSKNTATPVPAPAADSTAAPAANPVPATVAQPPPVAVSFNNINNNSNGTTQLQALNRALLGWKMKTNRNPKTFEEFASAAGFQIPTPPPGKKYTLNSRGFIVLANSN